MRPHEREEGESGRERPDSPLCFLAFFIASLCASSSWSATASPLRTSLKGKGSSPLDENERRLSPRGAKVVMDSLKSRNSYERGSKKKQQRSKLLF